VQRRISLGFRRHPCHHPRPGTHRP
jgi:hypothetical protein